MTAYPFEHPRLTVGLVLVMLSPTSCLASSGPAVEPLIGFLLALTIFILLLATAFIIKRARYKRKHQNLQLTIAELEQRFVERTESLRNVNRKLQSEISQHEATEILLRETQDYLNSIINSMPSILIGVTRSSHVTHWNKAAEQTLGFSEEDVLGRRVHDVFPSLTVSRQMIQNAIDETTPLIIENIKDGFGSDATFADIAVYPLITSEASGAVIRIDDITMRVRLENLMIQNEKMMSLGELAAGLAHEINNPLSAVLHGVQNIMRRTSLELEANHLTAEDIEIDLATIQKYMYARGIFKILDNIRDAGERAAHIVTNMLEFSRTNSDRHTAVNVNELLDHSLELARNTFELDLPNGRENLKIVKQTESDIPTILGSAAELQQVILNLLRNAVQAFTSEDYGAPLEPTITLRARRQNDKVCIEVEDNGPGISDEIRPHIFEPFFTTKDVGDGTGLGLSVSYFIITEHHNGTIDVSSTPGQGTRFSITLPPMVQPSN